MHQELTGECSACDQRGQPIRRIEPAPRHAHFTEHARWQAPLGSGMPDAVEARGLVSLLAAICVRVTVAQAVTNGNLGGCFHRSTPHARELHAACLSWQRACAVEARMK